MIEIFKSVENEQLKTDLPEIKIGDTVKVFVKVIEGARERLQAFAGYVIAKKGSGASETMTVRRVSYGVGVERTFFLHSPRIDHIEKVREAKVRRAKLYYLRQRSGKSARLKIK